MTTPESEGPEFDKVRQASKQLASRIARARQDGVAAKAAEQVRQEEQTGMGRGFRLASEFAASVLIGGVLGYAIDAFLGTLPWGLIVMIMVGFASGVLNVVRAAAQMNAEAPKPKGAPPPLDDDENEDD